MTEETITKEDVGSMDEVLEEQAVDVVQEGSEILDPSEETEIKEDLAEVSEGSKMIDQVEVDVTPPEVVSEIGLGPVTEEVIEDDQTTREKIEEIERLIEKDEEERKKKADEEIKRIIENCFTETVQKCAEIAAKLPAHVSKSPRQHGTDISGAIMDLIRK
ncbi:hypothetical protein KAU11_12090 [Candidatus Babeliales bacterium]|nr:hypothetical protein [Candidatus Babeliales bacterium]